MRLNPPKQTRSQHTLDRFVHAAVRLLDERSWSSVTIADLAAAADASVGAFYARFQDKQALLDYLDERYAEELVRLLRQHMADASNRGPSLDEWVRRLMRKLVGFFRRYRGVVRTLVMEARAGSSKHFSARTERMNAELPALVENLFACLEPGFTTRAELRQAMAFTFSAMRDQILFPESIPAWERAGDAALVRAMTRNFLGYLSYRGERRW